MQKKSPTLHLFGAGDLLVKAAKIGIKKNFSVVVRTSPRLINPQDSWLKELKRNHIPVLIGNSLSNLCRRGSKIQRCDLGLSFGAPWIFKTRWIRKWRGNLFNCHNRPLPEHRGAGGASWLILMGTRNGASTIHEISSGIDNGSIAYQKRYLYPKNLKLPNELDSYDIKKGLPFIEAVLPKLLHGKAPQKKQKNKKATYWPRLASSVHGWINWNWSADHIVQFCRAFGPPYNYAKTCKGNHIVKIIDASKNSRKKFHPFQVGLIFRKSNSHYYIAANGGALKIKVITAKPLKLGDRLFTPTQKLEEAMLTRVQYTPSGKLVRNQ